MSKLTFSGIIPNAPVGRYEGVNRPYSPEDVLRLRGSFQVRYSLAERGANRLWDLLHTLPYLPSLGAVTGNQAMQMVRAGLQAIYLSGWQVAADNNNAGNTFPDQSLYPSDSGPELCRRINNTLRRADQIEHAEGGAKRDWFVPIVADAEAGFGGPLNAFEIMKNYIEAGASGVHFEDQLASEKKCGHLGGKEHEAVAVGHCARAHGQHVGARLRLAHCQCADQRAFDKPGQKSLLLLGRAEALQLIHAEVRMCRVGEANRSRRTADLFHDEHVCEIAEPGAAERWLDGYAKQADRAELAPQIARENVARVDVRRQGRDLLEREAAYMIAQQRQVVVEAEIEIDHVASLALLRFDMSDDGREKAGCFAAGDGAVIERE